MNQENIAKDEISIQTEEDQLYRENILDYYKHPRNKMVLQSCSIKHRELNPLCGDDVTVYIQLEDEGAEKSQNKNKPENM